MSSPTDTIVLEQLRTVNHHLRIALNQVDEAVVVIGAEPAMAPGPRIYFANRRAVELTGISADELVGSEIGKIYDPSHLEEFLTKLPIVSERNRTFQTDKKLVAAGRTIKSCRWTVGSINDGGGTPLNYILTFRELKDLRKNQLTQDSAKAVLEQSRVESLALLAGGYRARLQQRPHDDHGQPIARQIGHIGFERHS